MQSVKDLKHGKSGRSVQSSKTLITGRANESFEDKNNIFSRFIRKGIAIDFFHTQATGSLAF